LGWLRKPGEEGKRSWENDVPEKTTVQTSTWERKLRGGRSFIKKREIRNEPGGEKGAGD